MISIIVPEAPRSPPGAEIAAGLFRPTSPPIYSIRAFDHLLPSSFSSSFPSREREGERETSLLATPMNHASRPRFFRLNRDASQKIAVPFVFPFFIRRLISTTLKNKLLGILLKRSCRFLENEIVRGRPECKQSYQRLFFSNPSLHIKLSLKECWLSLLPSQSSTCIIRRHWNDYNLKIMYFKYTCSFLFIIESWIQVVHRHRGVSSRWFVRLFERKPRVAYAYHSVPLENTYP